MIPEHKMVTELPIQHTDGSCAALQSVLGRIGDKWTLIVIALLGDGSKRFNELRRALPGISQRMLTLTLRGLEQNGLVTRTVTPTTPPRVDYELSALGCSLYRSLKPLGEWAHTHVNEILAARERFSAVQQAKEKSESISR